jgi:hypothetical protein
MASRANWARMTSTTGGTGSLTLSAVSGQPTFAQAFGTGSTTVDYVIEAADTREAGTATYNGTTNVLSGRTVIQTWNGSAFGTTALNIPTTGVSIYCAPVYQRVAEADPATGELVTPLADESVTAAKLADGIVQTTTELQDDLGVPNTLGKRCELVYQFVGIANSTQVLDPKATFPYTIAKLNHEGSEALTANVRIGSTSVTGLSAVAVTTSNTDTSATAANVVAIGDRVTVIFTDIATTGNVTLKLVVDRD